MIFVKYILDGLKTISIETLSEDASKQGRIDAIDADEEHTLVSVHDVNVSAGEEVFATTVDDITCNTPKIGSQRNVFPGALLHNTIAQV
ncbi:hypothetical protein Tco_1480458, partial [Tanacetum coccineum]